MPQGRAPRRHRTGLARRLWAHADAVGRVLEFDGRSHEIVGVVGETRVRMAMGARRFSVLALVLRSGMTWAASGVVLGLIGAWSIGHIVSRLLFDVSATDPLTFTLTAFALMGAAVVACTMPALRATRIDPVIALRGD